MSHGPPPTDEELERLRPLAGWLLLLHYPAFIALAGAQVALRRVREWRASK